MKRIESDGVESLPSPAPLLLGSSCLHGIRRLCRSDGVESRFYKTASFCGAAGRAEGLCGRGSELVTQQLHSEIILNGLYSSLLFGSKLSNTYIQLGFLQFATKAFDFITVKNSYSYNTIASGFFKNKCFSTVLRFFKQMQTEGCSVDSFNLAFAIKSCIGLSILQDGKLVHCLAIKLGLDRDPYLVPALIDVYSDLGSLKDAHKLFEEIPEWNTVIWVSMMKGYLKSSKQTKVFELFSEMRTASFELEPFTSECLVRACVNVSAGKEDI
ncbi:unnamed protein product [Camellia sinensis]